MYIYYSVRVLCHNNIILYESYVITIYVYIYTLRSRMWRYLLAYTLVVCFLMYIWNVVCPTSFDRTTMETVGLTCFAGASPASSWNVLWPTLFIAQLILIVQVVIQLVIYMKSDSGRPDRDAMMRQAPGRPIYFISRLTLEVDLVFRLVGGVVAYAGFLFLGFVYEVDADGRVTLIGLLQVLLMFTLLGSHMGSMVKSPRGNSTKTQFLWRLVLVYEGIVLVLRYIYQFRAVEDFIRTHWHLTNVLTIEDFGLKRYSDTNELSGLFAYLFPTALLAAVTAWHLRSMKRKLPTYEILTPGRSVAMDGVVAVMAEFKRMVFVNSPIVLLLFNMGVVCHNINAFNVTYLSLLLATLFKPKWTGSWKSLFWLSSFFVLCLYAFQARSLQPDKLAVLFGSDFAAKVEENANWFGLARINKALATSSSSSSSTDTANGGNYFHATIWSMTWQHLVVMLLCVVTRASHFWDPDKDKPVGRRRKHHQQPKRRETSERWMADAEDADEYEDGGGGAPLLKSLQDFSVRFVSQGSVTLTMLVLLVSAFVHLNSISVVYLVVVRWILAANPVTVCRNWTYLAMMLVFVCVTQYFVMLWLPPFMNRPRQSLPPWTWFEFVYQEYFALNFQHPWGLFCDYMCLLVVFMIPGAKTYYLEMEQREGAAAARAAQLLVSGHVDSPPVSGGPVPGDVHDFTTDALRNQRPWRLLVFVVMNYWVFGLLVLVFVSGCVRSGVTSGIYLAFAIYMLLHVHAVDDPQSKMLCRLRDVSWGYLFLLILFQLPVFSDVTDQCEIGTNSQSDGVCLSLPAVLDFNKLPKNYPGAPPLHSNLPILSILIFWMTNIQELIFRSPMYDYVRAYTRRQHDQSHDRRKALHAEVLLDRLERWTALKQEKQAAILRLKAIISRMVNKVEEMMDIASGLNYSLPPSAPLAPTIVPHETTQNAVTVTWSPPPGPLLHRIRYYVVTRQVYPPTTLLGDYTDPVEVKAAAAAPSTSSGGVPTRVVVDGLRPGTSYQFKVSAASRMGEGPFSAPSAPIQTIPLNWGGTCLAGWVQYHKQRWPAPWTSRLWFHAKMLPRYAVIDSHAFVWYKNEAMALKHRSMKKRKRMKTSFLTRDVSLCDLSESTYGLAQVYAIHVVAIARNAHQVRYTIQLETADDFDRWVVELGSLVPRHAVGDRLEAYLEAKGVPLPPLEQMGMADDDDDEDGHRSEWSSVTGDESWLSDAEDEELCESRNIAALVYLAVYSFFYSLQDASMRHESQVYEEDDEMVPSWYEMLTMIINAFRSNSRNVCCVAFLCSFVFQGDLLNVVYVFAAFGFLLVENPRPHSLAWHVLMRYSFWVVCARYLFQLPFFCQNINTNSVLYPSIQPWCPDTLDVPKTRSAIQPMVYFGLYKFDGIANPDVDTMWRGVAWNFVVILCILFHRRELQLRGMWHKSVDHQHASTSADATSSAFDHINQARHTLMSRDSLDDMDAFDVANFLARHDHDADDMTDAKPAPVASTTTKPVVSSSKAVAFSIERQNSIADNVVADDLMEDAGGGETGRGLSDGREAVEDLPDRRPVSPREALLRAQYARLQQQDSLQHPYLRQEDEEGADRQLTSSESAVVMHTQDTPAIMSPREALLRRMVSTSPPAPPSSPPSSPRDVMLLRTSSQHSGRLVRNGSSEQLDENEVPPVLVDQPPPVSTTPIDLSKRHPKLVDKLCRRYPSAMAFVGRLWPPTPPHWDKDMAKAMLCPKPGRDYLAVMLLLPFVCIVYAFVFFKYFGEPLRDDSFAINASDSMLNGYMVLIVLFELTVMMWDRAAYVVGSVKLKVALHVTVLVGVHVGLWIMLPSYSQSYLPARPGLQGFYLLHCAYLWCSAYQIKHGYLVFRSNHYSKKSVHETSFADEMCGKLFKVYMFVPFAFEIRCLLDWMCSTTCLNKDMWLLLEETAATLFLVRQEMDERIRDAAYLKGTKRVPVAGKFVSGGVILVVMLLCVVAPLAMFSSLNPTTIENEITSTVVTLGLVQADGTVQQLYINGDTNSDRFTGLNIKASDTVIQKTSYASYSNEIWASSPPLRRNLVARLNSTEMLQWSLRFSFTRDGPDGNQVVATSFEAEMTPMDRALLMNMVLNHGSTADPVRVSTSHNATTPTTHLVLSTSNQTSISVTADTITMPSIRIKNFYTPVIKVGAQTNPVPRRNYMMRDLDIQRNAEDGVSWWVVRSPDPVGNDKLNGIAVKCFDGSGADKDGFCLVTISDNIVAGLTTLGIGSYGLTAVYIFVVFTVGAFFKDMLRGAMYKVLYEELPNPNDLLELVEV
ncbi:hypothetical protein, variant 3 [Aphanomyces astaci]|uniref:Fibronectin type-III domain-containing protein n=1 Tax=Aphanomyces astaci TaxID=112090 RepID=W4GN34_APHAT|nr:hypothetical protein, variant 3 [Aphanomyces astaci]ETV81095.1 hypothetical protein, variant 3 [Aphanomyces astaci]|eukprot:XP_009828951.1 hypothetical protein, variant 3 [Aphanomyces astaci]